MTAKTRIRSAAAIALMAATGALGLPSQAVAGKSHHLQLYKVEQHIDIEDDFTYTVSCKNGDIATDGMWRIDDVSQDNEFDNLVQWTLTVPIKATGVPGNHSDYEFEFLPIAGGDVQGKLIVVCLENPVDGHGHSHAFTTKRFTTTQAQLTAPTASQSYSMLPAVANDCDKRYYVPIAPGFDMTAEAGYGYVARSWETSNATDTGWSWRFNVVHADNTGEPFEVTTSFRCLDRRSARGGPGTGHRHRIVQNYKTRTATTPARTFRTHEVHCGEHYKGMVGMWDVEHNDHYFLGMDPRIKSRAFKFVNVAFSPPGPADYDVNLKLSCFKDRTS